MIQQELVKASYLFVQNSERVTNKRIMAKINKKGYVSKAHVARVTTINNEVLVEIRADGATVKFRAPKNELNRIYSNTLAYAEKYL